MRFSLAVAALSAAASVWAQTDHAVAVGQGGLTFTPNSITVKDGDSVTFSFMAKNHSVTQSTFAKPCERQTTPQLGVDSGFQAIPATGLNGAAPPQWKITITNSTAALWFFCAQANHCAQGMVFAINATPEKSFDAYLANAKASATGGAAPPAGSSSAPAGASTAAGGASTPVGGATQSGAAPSIATSAGSVSTGSVPTPATGLPVSSDAASETGSPLPGNGAGKVTSGLTGLVVVAVVALLL
jgi:plastocyanin